MIVLKKIVTAIGNPLINEKLKENKEYIVQAPDIQYEEDLIDLLKNKKDTEVLILNIEIIKKELITKYIKDLKKLNEYIRIIVLIQKEDEEIRNFLLANGIKDIFYGNKITIVELEEAIKRDKTTEERLTEEINSLKEIVLNTRKNKINKQNSIITKRKQNNK